MLKNKKIEVAVDVTFFEEYELPISPTENIEKSILLNKNNFEFNAKLFNQIEFLEYYYDDKTFIFQAPYCSENKISTIIYSKIHPII